MSNTQTTLVDFHKKFEQLGAGEVVLDVRRPDEFAEAHIPNALNIPVDVVAEQAEKLRAYKTVYIHCKRGGRAMTAFNALAAKGLTNLVCVSDAGMDAWIEKGFPVTR